MIAQVGEYRAKLEAQGWQYTMDVTFIEIYNEQIRDLLRGFESTARPAAGGGAESARGDLGSAGDGGGGGRGAHTLSAGGGVAAAAAADGEPKLELKHDPDVGAAVVTNATRVPLDPLDGDQIDALMVAAARQRAVGRTDVNECSSRSHAVFTLHLRATNPSHRAALRGALSLVDLAGSERLARSGATGERLKETQAINKSLACLTDVFVAISAKQAHVPFRNSKLTHLLQPALSGDGKTLMMVNLSPNAASYGESLYALRFAAQVNKCELGRPKKQVREAKSPANAPSSLGASSGAPRRHARRSF